MTDQLEVMRHLRNLPLFRRLDSEVLRATAPHWRFRQLAPREVLWLEGDVEGSMGLVVAGVLAVVLSGKTIATLGPGELVGEGTAFVPDSPRIATVEAQAMSLVATLERKALLALRRDYGVVYDALLLDAVRIAARRARETNRKVARYSVGEAVLGKGPSAMGRLWQRLTGQAGESKPPLLRPLLSNMMVWPVRNASVTERLAAAFTPERLVKGKALFFEGDKADKAYVLVSGGVDMFRYTGGQKARKLASFSRGALFGFGGLLVASTRAASCVANDAGWAFSMDRETFSNLSGHPGRYFREILLKSIHKQVSIANVHLSEIDLDDDDSAVGRRRRADTLDRAMSAMMGANEEAS